MVAEFLNKIVFTVFNAIISFLMKHLIQPVLNFVINFTLCVLSFYFYQISVLLLSVVDLLSDFFQMLAGIKLYSPAGNNNSGIRFEGVDNFFRDGHDIKDAGGDLLFQLLVSEPVMETFMSVFAVGLFLTVLTTMIMIIKQEFDPDKPNNKMKVVGTALKSFLYMIFVPVICIFGVYLSNQVLQLVHLATSDNEGATISGMLFTSAAQNAGYEDNAAFVSLADPVSGAITAGLSAMMDAFTNPDSDIKTDADDLQADSATCSKFSPSEWKSLINAYIYISKRGEGPSSDLLHVLIYIDGSKKSAFTVDGAVKILKDYANGISTSLEVETRDGIKYIKGSDIRYFDNKTDADSYSRQGANGNVTVYWDPSGAYRAYYNSYQVSKDFNNTKINYLILVVSTVIIIKALASASIALIMRLYKAVAFFLILPGVLGLGPLDGGATFSNWKKTFISEVLAAYGFVISVNLYLFLAPLVQNLSISYTPTNFDKDMGSGASGLVLSGMNVITSSDMASSLMKMMFLMAGALMIEKLASTISGFIGGVDLASIGKSMMSEVGKTASTGFAVGTKLTVGTMAATASMYGGIANGVKNMHDRRMLRKATKAGDADAVAFRQARLDSRPSIGKKLKNVKKAFRGGLLENAGNFLLPFSASNRSLMHAKNNFYDAKDSFDKSQSAYKKSVDAYRLARAGQADASKALDDFISKGGDITSEKGQALEKQFMDANNALAKAKDDKNNAEQTRNLAKDKYQKETSVYENTANTIAEGSFKNAEAGAAYALNTVLNNLPGADIAKNLWGKHKEAQDKVDNKNENNKQRAEDLKGFAQQIKDKIGERTPLGRHHVKTAQKMNAQALQGTIADGFLNSMRDKMKIWKSFQEQLQRSEGDPIAQMMVKQRAAEAYMTNSKGDLLTEKELMAHLEVYQNVEAQIRKIDTAGSSPNKFMREMEKIMATYNTPDNKDVYKDFMKMLEDVKSNMGG